MTVVRQNILSTVTLKNETLSNRNVRLHMATPEICQDRNLSSNPSTNSYEIYKKTLVMVVQDESLEIMIKFQQY